MGFMNYRTWALALLFCSTAGFAAAALQQDGWLPDRSPHLSQAAQDAGSPEGEKKNPGEQKNPEDELKLVIVRDTGSPAEEKYAGAPLRNPTTSPERGIFCRASICRATFSDAAFAVGVADQTGSSGSRSKHIANA